MVPFKLTKKVSSDTGPSLSQIQIASRTMPLMDNSTRIVTPALPPNQQRSISGASTTLPSPIERENAKKYVWNRIKLKDSPFPRYRHSSSPIVSSENRIFVTGGLYNQSVYGDVWQITANADGTSFTPKAIQIDRNTPPPRVGHASTLCGNAYVVFGGDTHKLNEDKLLDDDIYLFNVNSYKWTIPQPIGSRPLGRYGHKISIIAYNPMQTKLYLFGGQLDKTYFNDLAMFDLSSFRRRNSHWEFLEPATTVPPPLANHTMVTYGNKLWVFGGETPKTVSNETYCYDPIQNDWSKIETTGEIPPPVQEHASVVYKHIMCVFGGKYTHNAYSNDVYFLDLLSFKWYKLPHIKEGIPRERSGHSLTLMKNEKILIMGGDKFDYANSGTDNLHTSATDQGEGTLLYTLDLSHLDELCPGIMSKALLIENDSSAFSSGKFAISNAVEAESQEIINILTPRLPNTKTLGPNDIDAPARSEFDALNDHALPNQPDIEPRTPQPLRIDMAMNGKFVTINRRPETDTQSIKNSALQSPAANIKGYTSALLENTSSDSVIPKGVYDNLNLEMQTLHLEAQQKELETARHISELEKEVQRLMVIKESSRDSSFQMARLKNLEIQKTFLKSRVSDLEKVLDLKISQAKEIHNQVTIQNTKLRTCFEDNVVKREVINFENRCEVLNHQNEKLVKKMQEQNSELLTSLKDSSCHLEEFLILQSNSVQPHQKGRKNGVEKDEPLKKMDNIINEMHEIKRTKKGMQFETQKLNDEKAVLQTKLLANDNKLEALRKMLDRSSKSMILTKKAIDLSRSELRKYRECTDNLREEINRIKNEQPAKQEQQSAIIHSSSQTLRRMKVNNLKAELYISKGKRDIIKEELLTLKKRLYTLQAQQSQ
ncbi:Kel2p SKDI_07G4870 [Saccharomyces kudriavzevii IFO 1802]|uniref:KEL2-like protein n=2 Tax=Saccharomyces kudriavzevii (strain ATCC MYA-4449 / AS 2.2408 / CBS 8840 / NBRC 1802 / NCYC 2889) TaxID=226230 RepID=J6EC86_SACK1|nr:uncharacterized protein SKDI_07G4870 [Saccharomyces kudriavzevii IFO 1802]EJT41377.1 KEL2-like protein [Saccharomyces kudriavzevii IFO 1802]CAI4062932.1 hypothetical protein SKDI_07G4870 [Saccharomyces kudriavzevii IFO 1802]